MSTAGLLIIGNEILSGKVQDENTPYLVRELRALGVDVERIYIVPDEIDVIASHVVDLSRLCDYVLTTGGVGPTHDDVTMEAIATALNVSLVRHPRMEEMLRSALKAREREPNASELKMCQMPDGAELIDTPDLWFPLVKIKNIHIFPGIPKLLQAKFEASKDCFPGEPIYLNRVYVTCMESDIAHSLNELLVEFPELRLGSYPKIGEPDYRTQLTLESRDQNYLTKAVDSLVGRIPDEVLVRVE